MLEVENRSVTNSVCHPVDFRPISGFPGYRVGDDGSVWTIRNRRNWRRMKTQVSKRGYHRIVLNPGCRRLLVHRLVLEAFVGPCPDGMECLHGPDPNPANNSLKNLRWGTRKENCAERNTVRGSRQHLSKLTEDVVLAIRANPENLHPKKLAVKHGVHRSTVLCVLARRTWKHI